MASAPVDIILSVGTSLLTNTGIGDATDREEGEDRIVRDWRDARRDWNRRKPKALEKLQLLLNACAPAELGYRKSDYTGNYRDILPQEISYLMLLQRDHGDLLRGGVNSLHLLASDTEEGAACAELIRDALGWNELNLGLLAPYKEANTEVHRIPGLSTEGGPSERLKFQSEGVPSLLKTVQQIIADNAERKVLLNFTGGFKGIIPYTVLAALVSDHPDIVQHYLYGETDHIITLPRYPIGLDYTLWHRESGLLEAHLSNRHENAFYLRVLDPRMHAVAQELGASNAEYSLPGLLAARYEEMTRTDRLREFSKRIVNQLIEQEALRKTLHEVLDVAGDGIWLGDKLPMAADHAGRHHHNLLELAQMLLTPVAGESCGASMRPFMTQEERFVFLAALLLHDCGHTLDRLPIRESSVEAVLTRSEIRDWHHFLAYYRLRESVKPDLGWPNKESQDALHHLAAWLCVYHRRRAGWSELDDKGRRCPYWGLAIGPPLEPTQPAKECIEACADRVDFLKLVTLIRLVDGCDNQFRRIGHGAHRRRAEEMLEYDREAYAVRLRQLARLAPQCREKLGQNSQVASFLDKLEQKPEKPPKVPRDVFAFRQDGHEDAALRDLPEFAVFNELVRLADECAIRNRQYIHFEKHQAVERIYLYPASEFDPATLWAFDVHLVEAKDEHARQELDDVAFFAQHRSDAGFAQGEEPHLDTLRKWIEEEITSEIKPKDSGDKADSPMLAHLEAASGRRWVVRYAWKDAEGCVQPPFKEYRSSDA